jgi:hypothetical protein
MSGVPPYNHIFTLGARGTENILDDYVYVQEKVDGSQFRWGVTEEGTLVFASKSVPINPDCPPGMFKEAVEHIVRRFAEVGCVEGVFFYGEVLQRPRHNVLKYNAVPTNHIVMFDVYNQWSGKYEPEALPYWSEEWQVDGIPLLAEGSDVTVEDLHRLLDAESYLGGQKIEGVVIKNYNRKVFMNNAMHYLYAKLVRQEFKEHMQGKREATTKETIESLVAGYRTEARWQKAVIHLREQGLLLHDPKDIGPLIKEVLNDIDSEKEDITDFVMKRVMSMIHKEATKGLPEWYKRQLMEVADATEN